MPSTLVDPAFRQTAAILTGPAGHVRIDSSGMLQSAAGGRATKVGDSFVVHMARESLNDYPMGNTTSR